jgi:serine/threonine protein kinase
MYPTPGRANQFTGDAAWNPYPARRKQERVMEPIQPAGGTLANVADYELVRLLGEGNNGRYYLARPPVRLGLDDEFVALKVFAGVATEQAYERCVRELRAFAQVNSPYLVRIYDAALQDNFFYAMEYFPLGSLAAAARPLDRNEVLQALTHAALAAHALHEAGLVHGDIKPANVLLSDNGGKLSDLGLARLLSPGVTMTGMGMASSVEFLDPGVLQGERVSRSSEVWALGACLHRALSGTSLFGELPDDQPLLAIRRVLSGSPQVSDRLSPAEADLVHRCLAPVGQRLRTAAEVADGLQALLATA